MESQKQEKKNRFGPTAVAAYFVYVGIGGLISGFIHLNNLLSNYSSLVLGDTLFNTLIGLLNLISAYLLWKRKKTVLWVYGAVVVIIQVYAPLVGRGINLIMLLLNGFFFVLLFMFNRNHVFDKQDSETVINES